jgi:Fe-S cluster biogenesis protein NfuA
MKTDLEDKVQATIQQLRPYLKNDGGDMELIEITKDNIVKIKLLGACETCSISPVTIKAGLVESLKITAPEIAGVESI